MRLVCPNCDAEYEVDDSLVPPEGRDVQCSNCTTTWFQAGVGTPQEPSEPEAKAIPKAEVDTPVEPKAVPEPTPEAEAETPPVDAEVTPPEADAPDDSADDADDLAAAAAVAAAGLAPRKPTVDPEALDIIHEEVARETAARKAEAGGIETQPDLGLDDTDSELRASAARDRMARRRGLDPEPQPTTIEDDEIALEEALNSELHEKKELLPDIEEINSTLSPENAEAEAEAARLEAEGKTLPEEAQRSSGFRLGFGLMLLLAVVLLLLYIYATPISQRLPQLAGPLESYVAAVDNFRVWLDTAAQGLVEKITAFNSQP